MMEVKLTGRKALITGGSKGLGLAIARTFVDAGADVAEAFYDAEMREHAAGGEHLGAQLRRGRK